MLNPSDEQTTDPMDERPIMDPMDKRPIMDPIDKQTKDPKDNEPMTNAMDNEPVTNSSDMSDKSRTTWGTPELCQTCVHTKQQQHVIGTKASRTSMPFELIHSDLFGPIKHSIGGTQYYIIYIDDCTRYTGVYFLITKTAEEISP